MPWHVTVGEAARRAQLTPRAVRLYESRGLLPAVDRSAAGYRLYSAEDVRLLRFIGRARAIGLGLDAIGALVELRRHGVPPGSDVLAVLDARRHDLDRAISDLQAVRTELAAVFQQAQAAAHRDGDAHLCRILETATGPTGDGRGR